LVTDNAQLSSAVAGLPTGQFAEFVQSDGSHNFIANVPSGFNNVAVAIAPAEVAVCGDGIVTSPIEVCDYKDNTCCNDDCDGFEDEDTDCTGPPGTEKCAKFTCQSDVCTITSKATIATIDTITKKNKVKKSYQLNGTVCKEPSGLLTVGKPAKITPGVIYPRKITIVKDRTKLKPKKNSNQNSQPTELQDFQYCDGTGQCTCQLGPNPFPTVIC